MFKPTPTWLISHFTNFSCELGSINTRYDFLETIRMIGNRLQFYLMLLFINFLCELGIIITRYDFRNARFVMLKKKIWTDLHSTYFTFGEFGQIMTRYDFLEIFLVVRKVIMNVGAIRPTCLLFNGSDLKWTHKSDSYQTRIGSV